MLAALICLFEAPAYSQNKNSQKGGLNTICIDPGHGGHDPGCVSRDGKNVKEKDIVLSVGLKLRKLLNEGYPGMKVVMTRETDKFIELGERANIANRNNSDLFISIHVNAVDPKKNKNWQGVSGFSIHTLGQSRTGSDLLSSNMELCKRENSVILLENDYDTKYQGFNPNDPESYIIFNLMQNSNLVQSLEFASDAASSLTKGPVTKNRGISQDPFLVLWKTTMPAVLVECGFITSTTDLSKMNTEAGQNEIAMNLFKAIVAYKNKYDQSMNIKPTQPKNVSQTLKETPKQEEAKPTTESKPSAEAEPVGDSYYGTQVLATSKQMKDSDAFFKGYTPSFVKSGSLYKYFIGTSKDINKAKQENSKISKLYPGSFLVKVEGEIVERVR